MRSPTERTLIWLRDLGYVCDKVEQRVFGHSRFAGMTRDFLGFADILAIHKDFPGVLAVQATTTAHLQERIKKVREEPRADLWLAASNRIYVIGWALRGGTGKRKLWTPQAWSLYSNLEPVMIEPLTRGAVLEHIKRVAAETGPEPNVLAAARPAPW